MINLKQYTLDNSIKANRYILVPKRYVVGLAYRHSDEKAPAIFKIFSELFNSNQTHRQEFDSFIDSTFELDAKKRIVLLKKENYNNLTLSEDYPFNSSLINGLQIIKEILGGIDLADITDEVLHKVMNIRIDQVEEICYRKQTVNCEIDQNIFDFVMARECLLNQQFKKADEIANHFFKLLIYKEIFSDLLANIKPTNKERCLESIQMLSLTTYDPRFELRSIEQLADIDFNKLFYYVGTNINILVNVLNYFSEEPEDVVPQIFYNYLKNLDDQLVDILTRRETETLDTIGKSYDLTRERVRQIEQDKGINPFNEFYLENFASDNKDLIFVFPRIANVFPLNIFKEKLGDRNDCFRNLMSSIKYASNAKYYRDLDAIVEDESVYNIFKRNADEVLSDYFKTENLDEKVNELLASVADYGFTRETILNYIHASYKKGSKKLFSRLALTKVFKAESILIAHFDNGFHFSDLKQIEELNKYAVEEFGEVLFEESDLKYPNYHIVQAIIERANVRLTDRGTYTHASKTSELPMELLEKIVNYLNEKNAAIPYSDLFEQFKTELLECNIKNKYALQGAMSVYIGELYKGKRDYVTPIEMQQTLRDNICSWMNSRPGMFSYEDFEKEFKGVALSVFMSAIYEIENLAYFWQQGYIDVNKLPISEENKTQLKQLINYLINQYHMEYCSIDELFELVNIQMKDLISNCKMKYSYDLFSVAQILFKNEYKFKRPLIGSKDAVFESSYEIIDGYLASREIVKFTKLRKYVDMKTGNQHSGKDYVTMYDIVKSKWNEYVPIDAETMVRKETIQISEKEIVRLDVIIDMLLEQSETVSIKEDLLERHFFTQIANMNVNNYLFMGLVNTFLHDKYEVVMDASMFKYGSFSIKRR